MNKHGHEINIFAVGTNLGTCQKQPALGCVYKLVEIEDIPRIKFSEDIDKTTIPGSKLVYRFYNSENKPFMDILLRENEVIPVEGEDIMCCNPSDETKNIIVKPSVVNCLHKLLWKGANSSTTRMDENIIGYIPNLKDSKSYCDEVFYSMPNTITCPENAEIYPVYLSVALNDLFQKMILENIQKE
jgi:nicotinate phosphoribosyltransferase